MANKSCSRPRTSGISRPACAASCCCASSEGYEQARHAWNGAFDRHPALIARCSGAADVMRGGEVRGRQPACCCRCAAAATACSGQSVCEKGLMIDLSQMNGVRVDPRKRIADRRGRRLAGCARSRVAGTRPRHHGGHRVAHRRRRTHAGRRLRPHRTQVRTDLRQRACDRPRDRRRKIPDGQQPREQGAVLGFARRRRKFRCRDIVRIPAAPVDPVMLGGELVFAWEDAPAMLEFYLRLRAAKRRTSSTSTPRWCGCRTMCAS